MVNHQKARVGLDSVCFRLPVLRSNSVRRAKALLAPLTKTAAGLQALLIWPVEKSPARNNSDSIIVNFKSVTANFRPTSISTHTPEVEAAPPEPASRVTGEGSSTKVTGDDWDRGEHVTGTEGVSARRRNPSRSGSMGAMPPFERKRNEQSEWPESRVTGSSGNTSKGSLITVSGGARG